MNNIVIYSSKPMPGVEALLAEIDDADVRTIDINQMKDYAVINPSLMIVENPDVAKDALMTNKLEKTSFLLSTLSLQRAISLTP